MEKKLVKLWFVWLMSLIPILRGRQISEFRSSLVYVRTPRLISKLVKSILLFLF